VAYERVKPTYSGRSAPLKLKTVYRGIGGCMYPVGSLGLVPNKEHIFTQVFCVMCHSKCRGVTKRRFFSMARQPPSAKAFSLSRVRADTHDTNTLGWTPLDE
jgi:hypothetical protein